MVEIKPFRAVRYKSNDLSKLICPPYDIISSEQKQQLQKQSKFNWVNIELPDSYRSANKLLSECLKNKVLIQDKKQSIYLYQQEFCNTFHKTKKTFIRTGFYCITKIDQDYILKHEKTSDKPVKDRLNLLKTVKSNVSPIFCLVPDKTKKILKQLKSMSVKQKPQICFKVGKEIHRLWVVNDDKLINKLTGILSNKKILIADGHHRFRTSMTYRDIASKNKGFTGMPYDYCLTYICSMSDPGLLILPTHRVVNLSKELQERVLACFDLSCWDGKSNPELALYKSGEFKILTLKPKYRQYFKLPAVTILDKFVLYSVLKENIIYTKDVHDAVRLAGQTDNSAAFLLEPPSMESIYELSMKNKVMPHKSTYFYPKVPAGVVTYKF